MSLEDRPQLERPVDGQVVHEQVRLLLAVFGFELSGEAGDILLECLFRVPVDELEITHVMERLTDAPDQSESAIAFLSQRDFSFRSFLKKVFL